MSQRKPAGRRVRPLDPPGELAHFGYAIVRGLVPLDALADLRSAIELGLANQARELVSTGLLPVQDEGAASSFEAGMSLLFERNIIPPGAPVMGARVRAEIATAVDHLRRHPAIARLAKEILGPPIVATPQFAVRAHCPGRLEFCYPWHQDIFFLDLDDKESARRVNFWVPLVPIDADAGGIELIRESHLCGVLPHARERHAANAPWFMGVERASLPGGQVIVPRLDVGDAIVMLEKTVHRSRPNRGRRVRWSVDIRYARAGEPVGRSGRPLAVP
jgi:Phytanoyl-CoA dioxygenase (PhyH)